MNNRKGIYICGAGQMQIPVMKVAREMGLYVAAADGNPDAPGREFADSFYAIDLKDRDRIAESVVKMTEEGLIHGVMTAATDFSATVAWAAEKAGLTGIPFENTLKATNKGLMRKAFSDAAVPSPRYTVIESESQTDRCSSLSFPLVVKPVDNMGARGIRLAADWKELEEALKPAFRYSKSGKVIVEEYIDGPEYSIDALVYQGEITICGIADRHIFFPPYFIEMGHTIPTSSDKDTVKRITEVFNAGVRALGIDNGAAKGDVKMSAGGPVVGEIAARLSGGYMSGWTFPYSSGLEVTRGALRIALGMDPGDLLPRFSGVSAERAWISIPGTVERVSGLREAGFVTFVKNVLPRVSEGMKVVFPRNNVEKCGNIISAAADRKNAVEAAEKALKKIRISLKAGDPETEEFLFRDSHFPNAFEGEGFDPENFVSCFPDPVFDYDNVLAAVFCPVLPEHLPEIRDWQGRSLEEVLDELYNGPYYCRSGGIRLGRVFRKAVIKGSWQGADWLARTLSAIDKPARIKEMLEKWR